MMNGESSSVRLRRPSRLDAVVCPPGSKSLTNRALLLAGVARGRSQLTGLLDAEDSRRMRTCLERLGVSIEEEGPTRLTLEGCAGIFASPVGDGPLFAGAAGTVARFLTAMLAARPGNSDDAIEVDAAPQMRERPMEQLLEALTKQGAKIHCRGEDGHLPVAIDPGSSLRGGEITLTRPASSQLVSGLVLAASLARAPTRLILGEGTPARPYVDMTIRLLEHFGGCACWESDTVITIEPRLLAARDYAVEPDASSASYFLGMAAIHGGRVCIRGLGSSSLQGDAAFYRALERMGAQVEQTETETSVTGRGRLSGVDLDFSDTPDMTLTLAVAALFAEGTTTIRGVEILRHHESDRLAAATTELRKLGARVEERPDGLRINPPPDGPRTGVAIDTYQDHRMAMAFAMIGDVEIRDPDCVAKTFPGYFSELECLGRIAR